MITSKLLASRLCRGLLVDSYGALPIRERLRVMDAANMGWAAYLGMLPMSRKETQVQRLLNAPLQITIGVTDASAVITYGTSFPHAPYTAESELYGNSVQIPGDAKLNRLDTALTLMGPFLGTTGSVAATFYGDALKFTTDQLQIVQPPRWLATGASQSRSLIHLVPANMPPYWEAYPYLNTIESGEPLWYWTEPLRPSSSVASSTWLLRVWPLPAARGTLSFSLASYPAALSFDDLSANTEMAVPDRELPWLLALCEQHLITSPIWNPDVDRRQVVEAAGAANTALFNHVQQPNTAAAQSVGTPEGY